MERQRRRGKRDIKRTKERERKRGDRRQETGGDEDGKGCCSNLSPGSTYPCCDTAPPAGMMPGIGTTRGSVLSLPS